MKRSSHDPTKLQLDPKVWLEQLDELYDNAPVPHGIDNIYDHTPIARETPRSKPTSRFSISGTREEVAELSRRLEKLTERIRDLERRQESAR